MARRPGNLFCLSRQEEDDGAGRAELVMTEASNASDTDLLGAIRAGDGEALACLFRCWQEPIYGSPSA
jgi:hypothetical protein